MYSHIKVVQHTTYFDGEPHHGYEIKWIGSKYAVARISNLLYHRVGIAIYPWPLKVIEDSADFGGSVAVVRKDVGWHIWWILVSLWYKLFRSRSYYHFKWRVVRTFEIWGLAYQEDAETVRWRNIGRKRGAKS